MLNVRNEESNVRTLKRTIFRRMLCQLELYDVLHKQIRILVIINLHSQRLSFTATELMTVGPVNQIRLLAALDHVIAA